MRRSDRTSRAWRIGVRPESRGEIDRSPFRQAIPGSIAYRDCVPVASIRGRIQDSQATGTDLATDVTAVSERPSEAVEAHRHEGKLPMARLRESVDRRFFSLC
jgi:hypothetical protein